MKDYKINNLRNIGIIGHSSSGKTSLTEALLYSSKTIDRLGKVEDGSTISDFDQEEKKRKMSLSSTIAPIEWEGVKINILDLPGYFDFVYEQIEGMRAVDVATIVVCGVAGVQVGTEKAWEYCNKIKLPRNFFINKLDRENSNFDKTLQELKDKFGISVVPIQYPIGNENDFKGVINVITKRARIRNPKTLQVETFEVPEELLDKVNECKDMIVEAVAQTDEVLLEKYFNGEELTDLEIYEGLINGCAKGDIAPVMCGSATNNIGIETLLEDIIECFPSPKYAIAQKAINVEDNDKIDFIQLDENKPFSAFVFKTIADPFVGKISLFRVITGKINDETVVINSNKNKQEKMSHLFFVRGKNQIPTKEIVAGDIGGVSKLQYTSTGDTLCDNKFKVIYDKMNFPKALLSKSAIPLTNGDEEKILLALTKLSDEDPVFKVERDVENSEIIISGIGETHLEVISAKLKSKYGISMELQDIKIPYRETIKGKADVQGKFKKQSGGHGQYGDVKIIFENSNNCDTQLEFIDKVVGGAVPRNFIPAVEKGLIEGMKQGILAGYPVVSLKATLYDGSYHSVDSSEMSFKIAASLALKNGLKEAKSILLEPIMHLDILVPDEYVGDVIGDINKKRGRVLGMEPKDKIQNISVEIPMAEIKKYATDLRSITQARGSFDMRFERYEEVPENEATKIIEKSTDNS
ncbi:MAG: elongation factor G [Clostridiales bacterium]|nr:elongation factor G [Clostridiales bacterium]